MMRETGPNVRLPVLVLLASPDKYDGIIRQCWLVSLRLLFYTR